MEPRDVDKMPRPSDWRSVLTRVSCTLPTAMTETDAERFLKEADECRQMAARAINPADRDGWLKLANDWMKLASEAERKERL